MEQLPKAVKIVAEAALGVRSRSMDLWNLADVMVEPLMEYCPFKVGGKYDGTDTHGGAAVRFTAEKVGVSIEDTDDGFAVDYYAQAFVDDGCHQAVIRIASIQSKP